MKPTAPTRLQERKKSGIYKITCKTCRKVYVGQTSRNLKSRFQEHIRYTKTMTLARHMHYAYFTADMNMVTLMTLWLVSSRLTHQPFCFHMNKCTSSRSTIIMNSSPNIWTSKILCLTSFIQILHVITHLTPNPQSYAFQPVLSQPVHETATYRVSTF